MQFERVTPESVGISSESILDFIHKAKAACVEMHGLVVLRHGKICAEGWWKPYAHDEKHIMFSFSKTLTATAIGFAEQEGILKLDEKLVDIFPELCPENPSENLHKADIWSLLTMSCGHENEIGAADREGPDWQRAFLHHEFKYAPGTMFQYNTSGTNMLAAILLKKTGLSLTEYLQPRLFGPLGMENIRCQVLADGVQRGGSGFFLSTEDMARFAQFYLQKGVWQGKRLLQESWFDRAGSAQVPTVNPVFTNHDSNWRHGYGFQTWQCIPAGVYRADGAYGQFGIVIPNKDAVIAINSTSSYPDDLLNICWETILAGMSDEGSLPENPAVSSALCQELKHLSLPVDWGIRCRASETYYDGLRFTANSKIPGLTDLIGGMGLRSEEGGEIRALSLSFVKDKAVLTAEQEDCNLTLHIGLNGEPAIQRLNGRTYASSGCWRGTDIFEINVRCVNFASGTRIRLEIKPNTMLISRTSTLPNEGACSSEVFALSR